jgi:hypothetical protein
VKTPEQVVTEWVEAFKRRDAAAAAALYHRRREKIPFALGAAFRALAGPHSVPTILPMIPHLAHHREPRLHLDHHPAFRHRVAAKVWVQSAGPRVRSFDGYYLIY